MTLGGGISQWCGTGPVSSVQRLLCSILPCCALVGMISATCMIMSQCG